MIKLKEQIENLISHKTVDLKEIENVLKVVEVEVPNQIEEDYLKDLGILVVNSICKNNLKGRGKINA